MHTTAGASITEGKRASGSPGWTLSHILTHMPGREQPGWPGTDLGGPRGTHPLPLSSAAPLQRDWRHLSLEVGVTIKSVHPPAEEGREGPWLHLLAGEMPWFQSGDCLLVSMPSSSNPLAQPPSWPSHPAAVPPQGVCHPLLLSTGLPWKTEVLFF